MAKIESTSGGQIHMVIAGKSVAVTHELVRISDIRLDPKNPRIRTEVESHYKGKMPTQEQLESLLWDVNQVEDLYAKIRDNKGTIDPILITADGRVVEGNCRTVAYRRLYAQKSEAKWERIPANRLPPTGVTEKDIDILLGMYHVVGKINWLPYEKAGHVVNLRKKHKMSPVAIAESIGLGEKEVKHILVAHDMMKTHYLPKVKAGADGREKYSYFYELVKNPKYQEFLSQPGSEKRFAAWVANKRFARGEDVRKKLSKVITNPAALKVLDKKPLDDALKVVSKSDPAVNDKVLGLIKRTSSELKKVKGDLIERFRKGKEEKRLLIDLLESLKVVASAAGISLK